MRLTAPSWPDVDLSRVDLADPLLYGDGEPHAVWQTMRRREPVRWQPVPGRGGFWAISRYADAERILTDHATFTSTGGVLLSMLGRDEPARDQQFAATDPPRHGRIRRPLQREMTVKAVARHAEALHGHIRALFDQTGDGEFDLAALTWGLPGAFLGPLLGLSASDWPAVARQVAMTVAEHDPAFALPDGPEKTLEVGRRELFGYLTEVVVEHRKRPREDLVDVLNAMTVDGERLTTGAVVANCYSIVLGATAAIPHVPTAAVAELVRTGGYRAWAQEPDLLNGGIEEALRFSSPAQHFMRHATRAVRIGETDIRPGDAVVVWIGSANRDEDAFADPHRFDIRRTPNRHLAFGDGHHYCIGATIARMALRAFFRELFGRFEDLEIVAEPEHVRSTWLAGLRRLPLRGKHRHA